MPEYWIWLSRCFGVTPRAKWNLLRQFGSPAAVYSAPREALARVDGVTKPMLEALEDHDLTLSREILAQCQRENIGLLTIADPAYPDRLRQIFDPPILLYYKGKLPQFAGLPMIGIVGTRKASPYGYSAAQRLGFEVSCCGGTVVSGLAAGIDSAAMNGALASGAPAVGVLGCGIDIVYPASNRLLYRNVEQNGCILSEYAPGTPGARWTFPQRNRIISGMSLGVAVVEAPEKSGALITARYALDQGRDVFVVPGNIDLPGFAGSNALLRDGAGSVSCGWDIMGEYEYRFPGVVHRSQKSAPEMRGLAPTGKQAGKLPKVAQVPRLPEKKTESVPGFGEKAVDKEPSAPYIDLCDVPAGLSPDEKAVVLAIGAGETLVDDVIAHTGLPAGKVLGLLTLLEIRKIVQRLPGRRVKRQG